MNPSREQIEARITALLLGELPAEEAELLRFTISQDAALKKLHDELAATIGLVREVVKNPADAPSEKSEPLQFSAARREKLLAHFQQHPDKKEPLFWLKRIEAPRLIPVLVCVALVALLAAMMLPALSNAKSKAMKTSAVAAARQKALEEQMRQDDEKLAANQPAAFEPATVAVAPSAPVAAPTATQIVLPPTEQTTAVDSATGSTVVNGQGGVYSQNVVGYANISTTSGTGQFALNEGDASQHSVDTQERKNTVQKSWGSFDGSLKEPVIYPNGAIAGAVNSMPPGSTGGGEMYVIKPGDTLSKIAKERGTTVQALEDANNLSSSKILAGARLKMPAQAADEFQSAHIAGVMNSTPHGAFPSAAGGGGGAGGKFYNSTIAGAANGLPTDGKTGGSGFGGFGGGGFAENTVTTPATGFDASGTTLADNNSALRQGLQKIDSLTLDDVDIQSASQNLKPHTVNSPRNLGEEYRRAPVQNNDATFADTAAIAPAALPAAPEVALAETPKNSSNNSWGLDSLSQNSDQAGINRSRQIQIQSAKVQTAFGYNGTLASADKVPVLGDVPLAGRLFQSSSDSVASAKPAENKSTESFESPVIGYGLTTGPYDATAKSDGRALESETGTAVNRGALTLNGANTFAGKSSNRDEDVNFKVQPDHFYAGLAKDDVAGLRYLTTTNAVEAQRLPGISSAAVDTKEMEAKRERHPTVATQPGIGAITPAIKTHTITNDSGNLVTVIDEIQPFTNEQKDQPLPQKKLPALIPQPEILCAENNFSTFSLNVSDVSFKLAAASLERGQLPDAASIRSEEFINAFDYRDPEAKAGQPLVFASERARYPFAHNRDLLRFSVKTAAAGRPAGRALNLVLLIDNSGSMERADRVAIIREALKVLASQLQPQDTVSVVTFARTARLWADGVSGDTAGAIFDRVGGITPEGGTNLEEAMRLAYETARRHYLANGMNRVVLLTDGAANLGDVSPADLKQKVEAQRKQGIALDCFGIGFEDYNDDLLEQLSSNGDGRYAFLNSPEDASKEFAAKLAGALQIAAQDVKVQVEFNPQRVISWRQIGYAKHQLTKEQFRDNTVAAGEIAAQEAGNALYTVETKPDGVGPIATVRVRYRTPGTQDYFEKSWLVEYSGTAPALDQSTPAMWLAATASAFSEWLAASPFAQEVTLDELQKSLSGVPQIYGADERPKKLEAMLREAKSISGK